jgi:hypothetical protein
LARPAVPAAPKIKNQKLKIVDPIDVFIVAKLASTGLRPAPFADRRTLIRRLSIDISGLPPTFAEAQAFANDRSPNAYEKVVDRLLASPHFGERIGMMWLDLVRYADTRGYHGDQHQDIWPYRDWVIKAFNNNMRFDRFTAEQLAGDLLPNANMETRVASGYNKLLMTTEEGGAQAKEYIAKYAADRVRNISAAWLGSTMGCCECHNHKYDPFSQRDFYAMAAFFADVKETPVGNQDRILLATPDQNSRLAALDQRLGALRTQMTAPNDELDGAQRIWEQMTDRAQLPQPIKAILEVAAEKRTPKQRDDLRAHFRSATPTLEAVRKELATLQNERNQLDASIPRTMVTEAINPPRTVRLLPRGNWLDDSGDIVQPQVPTFIDQIKNGDQRASRLDLASWLTSKRNPLTARVMANRFWKMMFGRGIASTMEDFGAQGARPTHPELLDWLASEFIDSGWDVKHTIKRIAMSDAYKRSSTPTEQQAKVDPANDLFARQGRFRMDAELLRDQALTVSGLLVDKVGGPPVKPYQPAGYWAYLNFPVRDWYADKGENQYRRGVYTYWCRTYLQPSLLAFDAPTREECNSARLVSNTPQQALVLLNDPTYVEAARVFAERLVKEGGSDDAARIRFAFQQAMLRDPSAQEASVLAALLQRHRKEYAAEPASADGILTTGEKVPTSSIPKAELAAWTSLSRVILNLHETITRS